MANLTAAREGQSKDTWVKVRVSQEEKDIILAYCGKHDMKISDFLRKAINAELNKQED